jgi:hypothetical protein
VDQSSKGWTIWAMGDPRGWWIIHWSEVKRHIRDIRDIKEIRLWCRIMHTHTSFRAMWMAIRSHASTEADLVLRKLGSASEGVLTESCAVGIDRIPPDGYHSLNFGFRRSHPHDSLDKGRESCPPLICSSDCPHCLRLIGHVWYPWDTLSRYPFRLLTFHIDGFRWSQALNSLPQKRIHREIMVLEYVFFHAIVYVPPEKSPEVGAIPDSWRSKFRCQRLDFFFVVAWNTRQKVTLITSAVWFPAQQQNVASTRHHCRMYFQSRRR